MEGSIVLRGKTALVTGSSRGIGLGVAKAFVDHGATVMLTAEQPASAFPELTELLQKPETGYFQADLSREDGPEQLLDAAWSRLGSVDILVNNLGTFREPEFLKLRRQDFDWLFQVNLWSAIAVTQGFVRRRMQEQCGGRILFSSSLNATRSEPGHTLYDASKAAISAVTRQLAIELAPHGFTTVAIAPGLVETPLTDFGLRSDPVARKAIEAQIPLRRIATVDDLAAWYLFLASDAAGYATGTTIIVDGGLDAQQMPTRPIAEKERE